jgi:DNA-binding Xre family transcriptional regulator
MLCKGIKSIPRSLVQWVQVYCIVQLEDSFRNIPVMKFSEALGATMVELNITGTSLSETSGIATSRLSRFLNGTAIKSDGLDALLDSLDDDVFQYLMTKLVAQRGFCVVTEQPPTLSKIVQSLNGTETAEMLSALAEKVRKETTTESIKKNVLVTT